MAPKGEDADMSSEMSDFFTKLMRPEPKDNENIPKVYLNIPEVEDLSTEEFIQTYEKQNIPVIIRNHKLDWEAFEKWDRAFITEKIMVNGYRKYLRFFPKLTYPSKEVKYLRDVEIGKFPFLKEDYTIPCFFAEASYQPEKYQWIFLGPPSSMSQVHQDVEYCHAWNISIYGSKYWWFFPDSDRVLVGFTKPRDIIFTPGGMFHAVVNLEETLSITHNYKR